MTALIEPRYPSDSGKDGKKKKIRKALDTYVKIRLVYKGRANTGQPR